MESVTENLRMDLHDKYNILNHHIHNDVAGSNSAGSSQSSKRSGESRPLLQDDQSIGQQNKTRTSELQTLVHLLKGNIGPGCLSLPWAFSQLGISMGFVATIFLALLTAYNSLSIIYVKRLHMNERATTFGDLGELAYGSKFRAFVIFSLCAQQLAICTVFFSFIGDNVAAVAVAVSSASWNENAVSNIQSDTSDDLFETNRVVMAITLPIVMFLSCLPNLKVLAPVTATGTIFLFLGFGFLGIVSSLNWHDRPTEPIDFSWRTFPLAISSIMYSFEGINLVLPVESAMKKPENFVNVYIVAKILIILTFALFSTMCVLAFGKVNNGSISAFLMIHDQDYIGTGFVIASNIIISLSVLFTYPLQLFPCISILSQVRHRRLQESEFSSSSQNDEPAAVMTIPIHSEIDNNHDAFTDPAIYVSFDHERSSNNLVKTLNNQLSEKSQLEGDSSILRAILVVITFIFAICVPNVQELISLVGSLAGTSMALIIPPFIKLGVIPSENEVNYNVASVKMEKIKCYLLIFLGAFLGIAGTIASCLEIFEPNTK